MTEINRAQWTGVGTYTHLEHLMKIKGRRLHDDSLTHDNFDGI